MKILKKILLFIASSLLVSSLLLTATFWILTATIGNRNTVKNWINDSGTYDNFVEQIVATTQENLDKQPENSSEADSDEESIDPETLSNVAKEAFSPEFLKTSFEKVIDGSYDWLEKETDSLQFDVDFSDAKTALADGLVDEAVRRGNELPECQTLAVPQELDIFSAECLPPGTDVRALAEDIRRKFFSNEELLPDPTLTAEDIKLNISDSGDQKSISEISKTDLKEVPRWYGLAKNLAWFMALTVAALSLMVLFLSATKRNGAKHLAKSFLTAAILIGASAFILQRLPLDFASKDTAIESSGETLSEGFGETIAKPLVEQAIDTVTGYQYWFAALYGLIFLMLLIYIILSRRQHTLSDNGRSLHLHESPHGLPAPERDSESSHPQTDEAKNSSSTDKNPPEVDNKPSTKKESKDK